MRQIGVGKDLFGMRQRVASPIFVQRYFGLTVGRGTTPRTEPIRKDNHPCHNHELGLTRLLSVLSARIEISNPSKTERWQPL